MRAKGGERTEPEVVHRSGNLYWMIFLLTAGVAIVGSLSIGIWQFLVPLPQLEAGPVVSGGTATFDHVQLHATVKALQDRQAKFDALSN